MRCRVAGVGVPRVGWRLDMPRLTRSGKKTALADVEDKLKREYGSNKGAIYGTLNKVGLMRGNRATAKGRKAAKGKR